MALHKPHPITPALYITPGLTADWREKKTSSEVQALQTYTEKQTDRQTDKETGPSRDTKR